MTDLAGWVVAQFAAAAIFILVIVERSSEYICVMDSFRNRDGLNFCVVYSTAKSFLSERVRL